MICGFFSTQAFLLCSESYWKKCPVIWWVKIWNPLSWRGEGPSSLFTGTQFKSCPWGLFQGRLCLFQHDNAKPNSACIKTASLGVLNWPTCSHNLSFMKKNCPIMEHTVKYDKLHPVISWNTSSSKNRKTFKVFVRLLQGVVKSRGDVIYFLKHQVLGSYQGFQAQ